MTDRELSEHELYRWGRYAFGRKGYRPVISLPESHANRLLKVQSRLEIIGIILFLLTAVLYLIAEVGVRVPIVIGALLIGFRAIVIFFTSLIVAQTVSREPPKEWPENKSYTQSFNVFAQVQDSALYLTFKNNRMHNILFNSVDVQPRSEVISVREDNQSVLVPSSGESKVVFNLEITETECADDSDILDINLTRSLNNLPSGLPQSWHWLGYEKEHNFEIPVTISGSNVTSSEIIEYKILGR